MAQVRAVLFVIVAFTLSAFLLVSWLGPSYINWNNTTASGGGMCLCSDQALYGARVMISYQLYGAAVGAGLGLVAGITYAIMRRKKAPAAAA